MSAILSKNGVSTCLLNKRHIDTDILMFSYCTGSALLSYPQAYSHLWKTLLSLNSLLRHAELFMQKGGGYFERNRSNVIEN
jgi:hypothetical protein